MRQRIPALMFLVGLILMWMQACAPRISPEKSCNFVLNSFDQRVSWDNRVPVHMLIHESVPIAFHQALVDAARWWNEKAGKDLILVGLDVVRGPIEPRQDGYSIMYFMNTWEQDPEHLLEQARTSIFWKGTQIIEADIRFNFYKYGKSFSFAEPVPGNMIDIRSLAIHEFGHVLGFGHIDDPDSVMIKYLANGEDRSLFAGVIEQDSLSCEY